jgi:hypothetical protein
MLLLLALVSASTGSIDCAAFAAQSAQPIEVQIEQLSGRILDPDAKPIKSGNPWLPTGYQIGKFVYEANGYQYRSADSRFPQVADSIAKSRGHICQYQAIAPEGFDPGNGGYQDHGEITFERANQDSVATQKPFNDPHDVPPVLSGYRTGNSFSFYTNKGYLVMGLMHPEDRNSSQKTAIVVSLPNDPKVTKIVANIVGDYSSISFMPHIHGTAFGVFVEGRGSDGSLRLVALRMDGQTADELATL